MSYKVVTRPEGPRVYPASYTVSTDYPVATKTEAQLTYAERLAAVAAGLLPPLDVPPPPAPGQEPGIPVFSAATLPSASLLPLRWVWVSDGGSAGTGAVAISSGSSWLYFTSGGTVDSGLPTPELVSTIPAQSRNLGDDPLTYDLAQHFTGLAGGEWTISGLPGAISAAGLLTIPSDVLTDGTVEGLVGYRNVEGWPRTSLRWTVRHVPGPMAEPDVLRLSPTSARITRADAPASNNSPISGYRAWRRVNGGAWEEIPNFSISADLAFGIEGALVEAYTVAVNGVGPGPQGAIGGARLSSEPMAPVVETPPSISPASGPVGTTYAINRGVYAGDAPISAPGTLRLGAVDVTADMVDDAYTAPALGELTWTEEPVNAVGPGEPQIATATVTATTTEPTVAVTQTAPMTIGAARQRDTLAGVSFDAGAYAEDGVPIPPERVSATLATDGPDPLLAGDTLVLEVVVAPTVGDPVTFRASKAVAANIPLPLTPDHVRVEGLTSATGDRAALTLTGPLPDKGGSNYLPFEWSADGGVTWAPLSWPALTTHTITLPDPDTDFEILVKSSNAEGESEPLALGPVRGTTSAAAPTITVELAPTLGPLTAGQTPSQAFTSGRARASDGALAAEAVDFGIDGFAGSPDEVLTEAEDVTAVVTYSHPGADDVTVDLGPVRVSAASGGDSGGSSDPGDATGTMATSVSSEGVTLAFDRSAEVGTYLDGTKWILTNDADLSVTGITPRMTGSGLTLQGGAQLNPGNFAINFPSADGSTLGKRQVLNHRGPRVQGYSGYMEYLSNGSSNFVPYDARLNVHPDVKGPLRLREGTVVVGRPAANGKGHDQFVVFHFVKRRPWADTIPRGYASADKTPRIRASDIDLSRFPRKAPPAGVKIPTFAMLDVMLRWRFTNQETYQVQALNLTPVGAAGAMNDVPVDGEFQIGGYPRTWGAVLAGALWWVVYGGGTDAERLHVLTLLASFAEVFTDTANEGILMLANGGHAGGRLAPPAGLAVGTGHPDYIAAARMTAQVDIDTPGSKLMPAGMSIYGEGNQHLRITPAIRQAAAGSGYDYQAYMDDWPEAGSDYGQLLLSPRNTFGSINATNGMGAGYNLQNAKTVMHIAQLIPVLPGLGAVLGQGLADLLSDWRDRYMLRMLDGVFEPAPAGSDGKTPNHVAADWVLETYKRDVPAATRWGRTTGTPARAYGSAPPPTRDFSASSGGSTGGSTGGGSTGGSGGVTQPLTLNALPFDGYVFEAYGQPTATAWAAGKASSGARVQARAYSVGKTTPWVTVTVPASGDYAVALDIAEADWAPWYRLQVRLENDATIITGAEDFGCGAVVDITAQSELAYFLKDGAFYNRNYPKPALKARNGTAILDNGENGTLAIVRATQQAVDSEQLNSGLAVVLNAVAHAKPNAKVLVVDGAVPGSNFFTLVVDGADRPWAHYADPVKLVRKGGSDVGTVLLCWHGDTAGTLHNFGGNWSPGLMKQLWSGGAYVSGAENPDGDLPSGATQRTGRATKHLWDANAPEDQFGDGLYRRDRTKVHLVAPRPFHDTSNTTEMAHFSDGGGRIPQLDHPARASIVEFAKDPRVKTFLGAAGPSAHLADFGGGIHPVTNSRWGIQQFAHVALTVPLLRALGVNVGEPQIEGWDATGTAIRLPVDRPNGGTITTLDALVPRAAPSVLPPHWQDVMGIEMVRGGARHPIYRGDAGTGYPASHKGTVTTDGTDIVVTLQQPLAAGEQVQMMFLRGQASAHLLEPRDVTARTFLRMPIEHVPALYDAADVHPFFGVPVRPQQPHVWTVTQGQSGALPLGYTGADLGHNGRASPPSKTYTGEGASGTSGGSTGGSTGGTGGGTADLEPPTITGVTVGDGLRPLVQAATSEPVQLGTDATRAGRFRRTSDGVDVEVFTLADGVLSITAAGFAARPKANLVEGVEYQLRMSQQLITDAAGNPIALADFTVATFTVTAPVADLTGDMTASGVAWTAGDEPTGTLTSTGIQWS